MNVLGFRKNEFELELEGQRHIQYFNRHFGYVLRPARNKQVHDSYAPRLHHLCLRVENEAEVSEAAQMLKDHGLVVTEATRYPQYAPDYVAGSIAALRLSI